MIKPKKLSPGDTIATVSLSWGGPGTFPARYEAGKKQLEEEFGVKVIEAPNTMRPASWIAQNPKARAEDLMWAFTNTEVKGIISTIGGEDSIRILPYLDLNIIRENAKVFMGYSDTTISVNACLKAGIISYYGPAIMSGLAENCGITPYTAESVRRTLFSSETIGELTASDDWTNEHLEWAEPENQNIKRKRFPTEGWKYWNETGIAEGRLVGGCVAVFDWLRGTDFWPSETLDGAILFIETSGAATTPAHLRGLIRSIAATGDLFKLKGILLGRPGEVNSSIFPLYEEALINTVKEFDLNLPIITNMDFGHTDPLMVLPLGAKARIDSINKTFSILESGVQ